MDLAHWGILRAIDFGHQKKAGIFEFLEFLKVIAYDR